MWVKRRSPQPVIPATEETEAAGSLEPKSTRIIWVTSVIMSYRRGEERREGQSQPGSQAGRKATSKKTIKTEKVPQYTDIFTAPHPPVQGLQTLDGF